MFALVVTGAPGSGKTTVLTALQNTLADEGIPHAVIEVEALAWAHPPLDDEQSFQHLAHVRRMYVDAGYPLILCGATITSDTYMTGLLEALAADERLVLRLEAEPATLQQRITEREPPEWSGLSELLDAAITIEETGRSLRGVDMVLSTAESSPQAIVEQVRAARPDVLKRGTTPS